MLSRASCRRALSAGLAIAVATLIVAGVSGCATTDGSKSETPADVTLSASVQAIDTRTGAVTLNGVDLRRPATPFKFDWGDKTSSQNFFPASHIYVDLKRNYIVKITAVYDDNTTHTISVPVFFKKR